MTISYTESKVLESLIQTGNDRRVSIPGVASIAYRVSRLVASRLLAVQQKFQFCIFQFSGVALFSIIEKFQK